MSSLKTRKLILDLLAEAPGERSSYYLAKLASKNRIISRQALHKLLNQLKKEGALTKINQRYQLNPVWLSETEAFLKKARERTLLGGLNLLLQAQSSRSVSRSFNTFAEADDYWTLLILGLIKSEKSDVVYQWHPYLWFLLLPSVREGAFQRTIERGQVSLYEIVGRPNTSVEEELYKQFSYPRLTRSCSSSYFHSFQKEHFTVIGEFVITLKLSDEALRSIKEVLSSRLSSARRLQLAVKFPRQKVKVTIQVKRAAKIAARYVEEFREYFGSI